MAIERLHSKPPESHVRAADAVERVAFFLKEILQRRLVDGYHGDVVLRIVIKNGHPAHLRTIEETGRSLE